MSALKRRQRTAHHSRATWPHSAYTLVRMATPIQGGRPAGAGKYLYVQKANTATEASQISWLSGS